jgi:hypothetical protein
MGANKNEDEKRTHQTQGIRPIWSANRMQAALSRRAFARQLYANLQPDRYERQNIDKLR